MRQRNMIAALTLLAAGLLPAIASAGSASAEQVGGVTILRGGGTGGPQTTAPAEVGSGSSSGTAAAGIEQSADWNAVHTGSGNAGGIITNPPPGAGR